MSTLELSLLFLLAAVLGVVLFRLLHLPAILAYLTVGILVGPHALGFAANDPDTRELAEFGVVFLMFSIGLEFNLARLRAMRRSVFGLGVAQVAVTVGLAMALGLLLRQALPAIGASTSMATWFALGSALAMSSTALVVKLLSERLEIDSPHGREIIGILLFQDLAVVPLLIIVPALSRPSTELAAALALAALKAAAVLLLLLYFGQKLMRGWFHIVARRRSQELFMLNLLLVTLGLAWITEKAGLSLALGAFVAGMLISETEYRHQVEEDIKPFRDVLLGLFFITIGMLLNPQVVLDHWALVLLLLAGPVAFKLMLITGLAKLSGHTPGVAIRTGLGLAQAGEFGFVLLNQAGALGMIPAVLLQAVLASMLLSLLVAPLLIQYSNQIALRVSSTEWLRQSLALTKIATTTMAVKGHVIVCGFGRSGQNLARLLDDENITYIALDLDPDRVNEAALAGDSVVYGDAGRREALIAAGVQRAAALVITYADTHAALRVLRLTHELVPLLPVVVRTLDDADFEVLRTAGATEVVPEIMEGSLMLASHALVLMGVPLSRVVKRVRLIRDERYKLLRGFFHGADDAGDLAIEAQQVRLHTVTVSASSRFAGAALSELALESLGVEVTALRRRGIRGALPAHDTRIEAGDALVLRGSSEGLVAAEELLAAA